MTTYETIGVRDEGTIVLLLLDGHPAIPFERRAFDWLAEERGFPDGLRGRVAITEEDGQQIVEWIESKP